MVEVLKGAKWAMESYISEQLREQMEEYQDVVKAIQKWGVRNDGYGVLQKKTSNHRGVSMD